MALNSWQMFMVVSVSVDALTNKANVRIEAETPSLQDLSAYEVVKDDSGLFRLSYPGRTSLEFECDWLLINDVDYLYRIGDSFYHADLVGGQIQLRKPLKSIDPL